MTAGTQPSWAELNQRHLMTTVGVVRRLLERRLSGSADAPASEDASQTENGVASNREPAGEPPVGMSPPQALEQLCAALNLSSFERDLLLLCAAVDLDAQVAALLSTAQKGARSAPTFGLALALHPEAHWSATIPTSPLRRWRLIEMGGGESLTPSPLRIDERVLHFLCGVPSMDDRLRETVEHIAPPTELTESHGSLVNVVTRAWTSHSG